MKNKQSNWLNEFLEWASTPCPDGEWVYRGQSAKYNSILPKGLRKDYQSIIGSSFYQIDYELAAKIFAASPVYQNSLLYNQVIDKPFDFSEVIHALEQHYDYATLFVDVSMNPIVAALFASNMVKDNSYIVDNHGDGVVFRWPANRKNHSRLVIDSENNGSTTVDVIDVNSISPHMRRFNNQRAALAHIPNPTLDMAKFSCCETFKIPSGGGNQLNKLNGVSMSALFPNAIDLGYSYIAIIALLSIPYFPETLSQLFPYNGERESFWKRALATAQAILDRECLRIIPQLPIPDHFSSMNMNEAWLSFMDIVDSVHAAIEMMYTDDLRKQIESTLKRQISYRHTKDWIRKQFDTRLKNVESIIETSGFVPIFAIEQPDKFPNHINS